MGKWGPNLEWAVSIAWLEPCAGPKECIACMMEACEHLLWELPPKHAPLLGEDAHPKLSMSPLLGGDVAAFEAASAAGTP